MFTNEDKVQIQAKDQTEENVTSQLNRFEKGFPNLKIVAAASVNDGIIRLSEEQITSFIKKYEESEIEVVKFVPASGAATRMFKSVFQFIEDFDGKLIEDKDVVLFFDELEQFAFYRELASAYKKARGESIPKELSEFRHDLVASFLLKSEGLNYGNLPKGLLSFHRYESSVRTAAQEQLQEGLDYAKKNGSVHLHFTVSPNHLDLFSKHIDESIENLGLKKVIDVTFSNQKESTDTIASTRDFRPFRSEGKLLFRPAGHGALLENLNEITQDLIFIKNIDNVVTDRLKEDTIKYKKVLAGVLLDYQNRSFELLKKHDDGLNILDGARGLLKEMGTKGNLSNEALVRLLNRPIRVCGMVKNEGEPGGGPFWVRSDMFDSLQIVESAQIDEKNDQQLKIFKEGTHFNPVDLVCGVKNYKGEKFNLLEYRDEETGFISEKSFKGKKLLAMELPGLWNGSMANWNTVFVEVPITTFNPVKKVTDLLKPNHQ